MPLCTSFQHETAGKGSSAPAEETAALMCYSDRKESGSDVVVQSHLGPLLSLYLSLFLIVTHTSRGYGSSGDHLGGVVLVEYWWCPAVLRCPVVSWSVG